MSQSSFATSLPCWNIPAQQQYLYSLTHHFWFANDTKTSLRVEVAKGLYGHIWTPRILDAAGVISPHQAVLGNPFPLDKKILDDVYPGINISRPTPDRSRRLYI